MIESTAPLPRRYYAYALVLLGLAVWDDRQLQPAPAIRVVLPVPGMITPDLPSHAEADEAVAEIMRFPNTRVRYYDVRGSTRREIARELRTGSPADMAGRGHYFAYAHWHFDWWWPSDEHGGCDLQHASVVFSADVSLPRLIVGDAIDPDVLDAWHRFVASLIRHEAGHVRHAYEHREDVAEAIRASRCATANQAALDAIRTLAAYDAVYDAATRHGATQGATFP